MFALGFHSLFEGLALGINNIEEDVIGLVLGIGIHKWAEGLSIVSSTLTKGSAFNQKGQPTNQASILAALYLLYRHSTWYWNWLASSRVFHWTRLNHIRVLLCWHFPLHRSD